MTIADMSTISVEIVVDAAENSKIAVGQSARIRVDAFSEKEISGSVTNKAPLPIVSAEIAPRELAGKGFKVTIVLRDIPTEIRSRLRPRMSATATITTKKNHH
jgi:multidrug resistance efflux pump